jgi:cell fate regulator YaaT (PSP1 superfamily)
MDNNNNYYTEKIAPKNKPERGETPAKPERKGDRKNKERFAKPEKNDHLSAEALQSNSQDKPSKMVEIIGIRFKDVGKVYYFSPAGVKFVQGEKAIVETARGVECGEIVLANRDYPESGLVSPLKNIIRKATADDLKQLEATRAKEKEIMSVFSEKIKQHNLDMKPIDIDCTFDGSKIMFYFTSDGRVDFRELVKDLAGIYRTRIELRQIGVRDEAKMLGGLGICGRPFCCASFLGEFQPVSIKMAKEQSLSLNPTKISGTCGRLMCCLKYEQGCYEEFLRTTPKVGAYVETAEGKGVVDEVNLLTGVLKVKLDKKPDVPLTVNKTEVKLIKDGQIRVNKDEIKALKGLEDN